MYHTIRRSIDSIRTIQSQILAFATLPIFNQTTSQVLVARYINTGIRSEEIGWFQLNLMDLNRPSQSVVRNY